MGQIIGRTAKPDACNLRSLSSFGTPAAGQHILVSTDNSAMQNGQGNFDAYVVGDGTTPAPELELKEIDGNFVKALGDNSEGILFSDKDGNVPLIVKDGHIKTKNFDSSAINGASIIDDTLSADALPDNSITKEKTIGIPYVENGSIPPDFGFSDENGNVVIGVQDGHVVSKNPPPYTESAQDDSIKVTDENKNVVLELKNGHIKTKKFDSSDTNDVIYRSDKLHFDYDHTLVTTNIREIFDISSNVREDYYGLTGLNSIMFQIQDKFDELVAAHPEYVSKYDAAELVGLEYPIYAQGITTATDKYEVTPEYRTYLYRFKYQRNGANGEYNRCARVLITGSMHGNEQSASLNLYTIAKELCEKYLNDINWFKFRGAFDVWIVPCIGGYNSIHRSRVNANGVNINRNFPINGWDEQGSDDPTNSNYRGPFAGSEFETQLIMDLIRKINPDLYIDAHNYSTSDPLQFYTEVHSKDYVRLSYDSLADVSFTLKNAFPSWFGTNYGLLKGDSDETQTAHAPGNIDSGEAKAAQWAHDYGTPFAVTLEISGGINYTNGELSGHDPYIEAVYQIGEYTMRNQLFRYGEYVSNKLI